MQLWDASAKPSPEVLQKHWSTSVSGVYREADGLRTVIRIKHPE